jgi:PhoPQ-activated pathogenicity-related protein
MVALRPEWSPAMCPGRRGRAAGQVAVRSFVVTSPRWGLSSLRRVLAMIAGGLSILGMSGIARAGLDEYVKKPDPAFAWSEAGSGSTPAGTYTELKLTSQVWKGITWNHALYVYQPSPLAHADAVLLFITGHDNGFKPGLDDHKSAFTLARACGARVAVLHQVPNQPLLEGKEEDELISETFVRYLQTGDEEWPLLFPMVKSAVRAMDAVQAWAEKHGQPATRFVVSGGSKRGWTTWLTGAVDDGVIAIAPMVIVMLNLGPQGPNQLKVWGQYSEQIHDYVERGLMERVQTPSGTRLWRMVDPYTYRERLTKPKLLINGTNDRYWTLDALDLYWGGLKGPKYLVELPNAGHGLDQNRDWAINGLGAFFRQVVTGRPLPKLSWQFDAGDRGEATLTIRADPAPRAARLWTAQSASRDFRESRWQSRPLRPGPTIDDRIPPPADGRMVLFGELEYEADGIPYHLTTTFFEPGITPPRTAE